MATFPSAHQLQVAGNVLGTNNNNDNDSDNTIDIICANGIEYTPYYPTKKQYYDTFALIMNNNNDNSDSDSDSDKKAGEFAYR